MNGHLTCWEERGRREKREEREEIELMNSMGESSKTNFPYFSILPQADPEAIGVIVLTGMPGLE